MKKLEKNKPLLPKMAYWAKTDASQNLFIDGAERPINWYRIFHFNSLTKQKTMNPLKKKAVSALQRFVSHYLLLVMTLLSVDNANAQQSSQNRIVGYWKGDFQTVSNGIYVSAITYDAVFADGSAKSVALGLGNGKKITLTATYEYWFEGNYHCTQRTGQSEISKSILNWVNDNECYQTYVNGTSKGENVHYVRVPKDTFEKYFNNSVLLLDIEIPQTHQPTSNVFVKKPVQSKRLCWTCYQTGETDCSICYGRGQTKRSVQRSRYDSYEKRYVSYYEDVWSTCTAGGCHYGRVTCTEFYCPYKK